MDPELWLCGWLASYSECPVRVLEWPIPAPDLILAVNRIQPRALLLHGSQRLNIEQLKKSLIGVTCPQLLAGQAVLIHQEELEEFSQLTCSTDPLQTYHNLLNLKLLQHY